MKLAIWFKFDLSSSTVTLKIKARSYPCKSGSNPPTSSLDFCTQKRVSQMLSMPHSPLVGEGRDNVILDHRMDGKQIWG